MATEVILPRVDMDMATGQIVRWYVTEGARVEKGQPLFEIETDKAAMEIEAPASGVLQGISPTGVDTPVGTTVGWIVGADESFQAPAVSGPAAAAPTPEPVTAAGKPEEIRVPSVVTSGEGLRATPLARRLARMQGIELAGVRGSGPRGRIHAADIEGTALLAPAPGRPAEPAPASPPRQAPPQAPAALREEPPAARAVAAEPARQAAAGAPLNAAWLRQGTGTPLVMVHGFGADLNSWRPLAQSLPQGRPLFAVDLPGHGRSALDGADSLAVIADRVLATLEAAGITSLHLVAHSLGAAVATLAADRGVLDVRSLLLISSAGLGPDINGAFLSGYTRARGEQSLAPWMSLLVADEAVLGPSFIRATANVRDQGTVAADQAALAAHLFPDGTQTFSVRAALGRLNMPVRLVFGTSDQIIPHRHAAGVPGTVGVHSLPGIGHMPHVEAKDVLARILMELVRSAE